MRIEDVKKDLGEDAKLFDFDEKDGVVAARLKKFYPSNEWAKIATRVKAIGGVYVPKDRGGPIFTFKGEGAVSTATQNSLEKNVVKADLLVKDAIAYLEHAIAKLKELDKR